MNYNTADIRQFLIEALSDEELSTLCADYFRNVYEDLASGMPKSQKIRLLLDYCHNHDVISNLLAALQRVRPEQYEKRFPQAPQAAVPPESPKLQRDPRQVFISHAHEDAEFAQRLADDLQQRGWRVWIAPESIRPGEKWVEAINRGLEESGVFALILTPAAIKSRWVKDETNAAIELEHEGRVRFVPLDVENCDVPPLWRAYQRVSFCGDYVGGLRSLVFALDPAQRDRQLREEAARREAERQAKLAAEKAKAERLERERQERMAKETAAKEEAKRKAREEAAEEAERKAREDAAKREAARQAKLAAEKAKAEQLERERQLREAERRKKEVERAEQKRQKDEARVQAIKEAERRLKAAVAFAWGSVCRLPWYAWVGVVGLFLLVGVLAVRPKAWELLPAPTVTTVLELQSSPSPTILPTTTPTSLPTLTSTPKPIDTSIPTVTPTPIDTSTPTLALTMTQTPTMTPIPTLAPTMTQTPTKTPIATPSVIVTRVAARDGMVMMFIPAGEFLMGSLDSDAQAQGDEKPQRKVYLEAFWIDQTEVTNAQYGKCVQAKACRALTIANDSRYNGNNQPVVSVDWNDAQNYCRWAWRRLPTEAQWEKAARGIEGRIYPWGNEAATCDYAVMDEGKGNSCGNGDVAWPVGSKPKGISPYGALDMAGNVYEWVEDWYSGYPGTDYQTEYFGQKNKVLRGGAWYTEARFVRAADRAFGLPSAYGSSIGFRCMAPGK